MATEKTKLELINQFHDGLLVYGSDFADLIVSLKGRQSPVNDPAASGTSVTFIATITQNAEGVVTVTKKTVNFSGYQTVAGMAGYQDLDRQQVGNVTATAGGGQTITHNMKHFPTVRLLDNNGVEVRNALYTVTHIDNMSVKLDLDGAATGTYKYILD